MRQNNKKILFISHEYRVNGSTVSLVSMIQGLKEISNVEIEVLIPYKRASSARELCKSKKIQYKEFLYRRGYKYLSEGYSLKYLIYDVLNLFAVRKISRYIKKKNIDIVCSNSMAVDVGARAAQKAKVEHIFYVREFMEEDHRIEFRNKERMRRLIENSQGMIFISKSVQEKYINLYSVKKQTMFWDGFILEDYVIPDKKILQKEKVNVIQIGGLSEGKGVRNSLQIMKALIEKGHVNFYLELVGQGKLEYINGLKQYIHKNQLEKNVILSGYHKHVKEKIAASDVLLMNSYSEGFGRVTVEGMLGGLLVLGRNAAGTSEIIRHEKNGLLFHDDKELTDILQMISANKEKYREIAQRGQKWALKKFDCKHTAEGFLNFINDEEVLHDY